MKTKIFLLALSLLLFMEKGNSQANWLTGGYTTTAVGILGTAGSTNITFGTNNNPQMYLTTTGFLGIGIATPGSLLDVSGGDINIGPPASNSAYKIYNNRVLWFNGSTNNIFVGMGAGGNNSGQLNTAVGFDALTTNTTMRGNTAVGDSALYGLNGLTGLNTGDVAIGNSSLYANTTGIHNTSVGEWAMRNSGGNANAAVGYSALYSSANSYGSSAIGAYAGEYNIAGLNTFLGDSAGWGCTSTTDTNDVFIGWQSGPKSTSISPNYVYIGSAYTTHISSDMAIITTWSDRRLKDDIQANVPGLAFITKLIPVTYHYDLNKAHELLGTKGSSSGKAEVEQITQSGFIAQQVDSAAQACGYDFSGVVRPKTPDGAYALGYSEFVVPLVKSVQELNTQNQTLKSTVDSLRNTIQSMQACLNQICAATGNSNVNSNPAGEQNVTLNSANSPILYQNSPNPFNTGTKINYFLPEGTMGATIVFYDTYGNQIKIIQLNQTGNGTLNITSDNLTNGIYSYSLIVNSTVVDTKKMVLQK